MRFERYRAMVLADKATYFRRFTVKFVEIVAAGIGTAVSGYVVAYVTGHLSWFTPAAVKPGAPAPQAISTPAEPQKKTASIEATVRAALASHHEVSEAAAPAAAAQRAVTASPVAATPVTSAPVAAAPAATTPVAAVPAATASIAATPMPGAPAAEAAPPLATTEIKSVPVAAAVEPAPLAAEPDGWPSEPGPMRTGSARLPPQPPPVNINVLGALRRLF